jgi:hypothetical protein
VAALFMGEVPLRLHPLTAHFATLRNTISISVAAAVIQEWNEAYFVHVRTETDLAAREYQHSIFSRTLALASLNWGTDLTS